MDLTNIVTIENVFKSFGSQRVVDNLSFQVPRGSLFGLIGPNGSGKTTTMRMILRIYYPDSGRVEVLGESTGNTTNHRVGYLPEERGLYPRMTVLRILLYFARLKNVPKANAAIQEWLERLGMASWANKRIDQLSKGMAQKVQFITAVIGQPSLVILDEPFSGLDPVNLDLFRDAVEQLRQDGTTVILSTHDMDVAQAMCDRVVMIYRGQKVLDGTLREIRQNEGKARLRVRMADAVPLPERLPGVEQVVRQGDSYDLFLESPSARLAILSTLAAAGDIEHFETLRPSLHDIFVSIAGPGATTNPNAEALHQESCQS